MKNRKLKNSELNRKSVEAFKAADKTPLIIVLDNIRSANNIGSVFRTADAFLLQKIYLCGVCALPPDKNIRKTALGSTETVEWEYAEDAQKLIQKLKEEGVKILSVEQAEDSVSLDKFRPEVSQIYALVFGNEIKGVQQDIVSASDAILEIPQLGSKHSLNISVSAGIVCWDLFAKLRIKKNAEFS